MLELIRIYRTNDLFGTEPLTVRRSWDLLSSRITGRKYASVRQSQ